MERGLFSLAILSLRNIILLVLAIVLYGCPIVSLLSLVLSPSGVFCWTVLCTYVSYALVCVFVLIMNLTRVNVLLYNYLASMICALCLTVTWCKGPSANSSWMPMTFATPASPAENPSV